MKYLCLVYLEDDKLHAVPDAECLNSSTKMRDQGRLLAAEPLFPAKTAKTLRIRDGRLLITDGPFADTKEQLAGFYLIDAESHDEALKIASTIPPARTGSIEVRPVRELQP